MATALAYETPPRPNLPKPTIQGIANLGAGPIGQTEVFRHINLYRDSAPTVPQAKHQEYALTLGAILRLHPTRAEPVVVAILKLTGGGLGLHRGSQKTHYQILSE